MVPHSFNPYKYRRCRWMVDIERTGTDNSIDEDVTSDEDETEEDIRAQQTIEECRLDVDRYQPAPHLLVPRHGKLRYRAPNSRR